MASSVRASESSLLLARGKGLLLLAPLIMVRSSLVVLVLLHSSLPELAHVWQGTRVSCGLHRS